MNIPSPNKCNEYNEGMEELQEMKKVKVLKEMMEMNVIVSDMIDNPILNKASV